MSRIGGTAVFASSRHTRPNRRWHLQPDGTPGCAGAAPSAAAAVRRLPARQRRCRGRRARPTTRRAAAGGSAPAPPAGPAAACGTFAGSPSTRAKDACTCRQGARSSNGRHPDGLTRSCKYRAAPTMKTRDVETSRLEAHVWDAHLCTRASVTSALANDKRSKPSATAGFRFVAATCFGARGGRAA